jgi:hypothetical protein
MSTSSPHRWPRLETVQADFDHVDGTDANRGHRCGALPDRGYPSATADPLLSRSESSAFVSAWFFRTPVRVRPMLHAQGNFPDIRSEHGLPQHARPRGRAVWTFFAPGQIIESDPTATAFSDTCLVCGGDTHPDATVTERTLTRDCRLRHPSGELPAWWTDWESSEVVDRHVIFTPDLVGGGNTWSTLPLGRKWGDEVSDLFWELRPTEAGDP